jgi:endonuclease I
MSTFRITSFVFLTALLFIFSSAASAEGTFDVSTSQLPDFRGVYPGQFSEIQFYYVSGSELGQNLEISVEEPFRISLDCFEGFGNSLSLVPANGTITSTRIYVRFYPETTGPKQGTITHQAGSVGPLTISLSGEGLDDLIPPGYYSSANAGGSRLKTQLFNIINNHQTQTYGSLWQHFEQTDATFAGKVWDMYSDTPCYEPPYVFTFVEDQDTGSGGTSEGDVFNREHSMPRSWFGGQVDPMHTDLFHIFPVDKWVNARRADYPYGEVLNPSWTSLNGGKLGQNAVGGHSGTAFEPIDAYKGDIARGFLYMITRYENQIESWTYSPSGMVMLDNNSYPGFEPWVISMLMQWHDHDPVSQKEILRNQAIYQIQGNRNPFIDHPEFVERIWGDTTVSVGNFIAQKLTVFPNPAAQWFNIVIPMDARILEMYTLCGKKTLSMNALPGEMRLNTSALNPGIYLLILHTQQGIFREKLIINKNQ